MAAGKAFCRRKNEERTVVPEATGLAAQLDSANPPAGPTKASVLPDRIITPRSHRIGFLMLRCAVPFLRGAGKARLTAVHV